MFEKEAKERAEKLEEKQTLGIYDNDEDLARDESFNEGQVVGYEEGFKDGAEFGYNKGKKEIKLLKETHRQSLKILTDQIEELHKANEWHYVKDGDLPKENQLVLLYRENSNGANIALTYWYKSYVKDKVIAWKEIVLPELKEIKEK